jgi:hypothetical protein
VSVVAVAAVVAALVLVRSRRELERAVEAARADAARAEAARAATAGELDTQRAAARALSEDNARVADEVRQVRQRADELGSRLEVATARRHADDAGEGLWALLLAHVTRRWAAVVGVPPDARAFLADDPDEQLQQALGRETERLREEVGVDVELSSTGHGAPVPATAAATDRVAVLVAALEVLGALASTVQRITVTIGDTLVLTGEGWVDPYGEVAAAHERAAAAGVVLGPLEAGDEQVRLVLHHGPTVTAAPARP